MEQRALGCKQPIIRDLTNNPTARKEELRSFAFLTVVMAPVLAGLIIAGYGFLVWIFQMFAGPPHA